MLTALFSAAIAAACPYSSADWTVLPSKRDLPPEVLANFGELADKGERFQTTDAVVTGQELPFSRFIGASARGCELVLDFEHGGRGYSVRTSRFQFINGHWVRIGPK